MRYQHPKNLEFQTTHSHVANGLAAVDGRSPPTPNKGRIGPKKGQRKEVPILSVWQYANIQAVCRISILEPHLSRLKRNGRSSNEVKTNLRDWLTIYVWVPTKAIHPHAQNQGSMRLLFTISDNRCYIFRTQTHSNRIPSSFTLCTKGEKWYLIQSFKV